MPQRIGYSAAVQLLISAELMTAAQAHRLGLVNEVVSAHDAALDRANELAHQIALHAPRAVESVLKVAKAACHLNEEGVRTLDRQLARAVFDTEDAQQGVDAFLQRKSVTFKGR